MDKNDIQKFLASFADRLSRTIVVVDFGNVEKWKESLGWKIGIQELATLSRHFSKGDKSLRRFYYGSDFGSDSKSIAMTPWSKSIIRRAEMNRFEIITKRVKYIHDSSTAGGFVKKCDLDVEMVTDLIRLKDVYDHIVLFSGDGDPVYALRYLHDDYNKSIYIFGARNHVAGEVIEALNKHVVTKLLFAEDFEYRLNMDRFRYK